MTDIEGSTRLWDLSPMIMKNALARHDEITLATVTKAGGTLVKSRGEGDSTFSVFTECESAMRCALDLQLSIATEPWAEQTPIRVRI